MSIFDGHTRGTSQFIDDLPEPRGTLHAAVVVSPVAHGRMVSIDPTAAAGMKGVVRILTAADIPGDNQVGGIIQDEPLFADGEVHFIGQPIAVVIADTVRQALVGCVDDGVGVECGDVAFDQL